LYKYSIFEKFVKKAGFAYMPKKRKKMENIGQYQTLCQLLRYQLSQDQELLQLHKNRLTSDCYVDSDLHILTQDFVYAVSEYLSIDQYGVQEEHHIPIITQVDADSLVTKEIKVNLTPRMVDYERKAARQEHLGKLGEYFVVGYEKQCLIDAGKPEFAEDVKHVSKEEGDGAGYDIESYDEDGSRIFIEVKTTQGRVGQPLYVTRNELERSKQEGHRYYLYRVYNFDEERNEGVILKIKGNLQHICSMPVKYEVVIDESSLSK
jgi:hypothetical protein